MRPRRHSSADQGQEKDLWDIIQSIGPLVVALAVSFVGGWYNLQQSELEKNNSRREVFTRMQAERERADSELRARMFETLFQAYFGKGFDARGTTLAPSNGGPTVGGDQDATVSIERQIMFLNLLARNFETIDIKPLFEQTDRRLSQVVWHTGPELDDRRRLEAFRNRYALRRVGTGLSSRQTRALGSLEGTRTYSITVKKCEGDMPGVEEPTEAADDADRPPIEIIQVLEMEDGQVDLLVDLNTPDNDGAPVKFRVNHYDMPYIDNSRLSAEVRLAVVLESYHCPSQSRFLEQMGRTELVEDYAAEGNCERANLRLIEFPSNYMGLRDRPYLEDMTLRILERSP